MSESITTISAAEYRALLADEVRRPHKYGAVRVRTEEGHFDSTGEYTRWCELRLLERQGAITDLRRQVPYPLVVNGEKVGTFVSDYTYREDGETIVEDYKGYATPLYRLKKRLMSALYRIEIRESKS